MSLNTGRLILFIKKFQTFQLLRARRIVCTSQNGHIYLCYILSLKCDRVDALRSVKLQDLPLLCLKVTGAMRCLSGYGIMCTFPARYSYRQSLGGPSACAVTSCIKLVFFKATRSKICDKDKKRYYYYH